MSQLSTPSVLSGSNGLTLPEKGTLTQTSWRTRAADYAELAKLRIAVMVLITVAVGYLVGVQGRPDWMVLLHTLLGVGLIAASSCVINQCLEVKTDALMNRTKTRPLPSGRISLTEAILFATGTGVLGFFHLLFFVNLTTALLTLLTWFMYVALYTPLKRYTSFCTAVGAVPGALPPVLGWAAANQSLGWEAFWLFSLMFLWQFPHFLAIAWLYRQDYHNAGLRMLPNGLPAKYITGMMAVIYAMILLPVSLLPQQFGTTGQVFFWVALALGLAYLGYSIRFMLNETRQTARQLLFCSLIYLPVILTTLTWNQLSVLNSNTFVVDQQTTLSEGLPPEGPAETAELF